MFTNYVKTPAFNKSMEIAAKARKELQEKIANKLGYKLMGHKLELYGVPLKKS